MKYRKQSLRNRQILSHDGFLEYIEMIIYNNKWMNPFAFCLIFFNGKGNIFHTVERQDHPAGNSVNSAFFEIRKF